jgi:hypothetical protein
MLHSFAENVTESDQLDFSLSEIQEKRKLIPSNGQ